MKEAISSTSALEGVASSKLFRLCKVDTTFSPLCKSWSIAESASLSIAILFVTTCTTVKFTSVLISVAILSECLHHYDGFGIGGELI